MPSLKLQNLNYSSWGHPGKKTDYLTAAALAAVRRTSALYITMYLRHRKSGFKIPPSFVVLPRIKVMLYSKRIVYLQIGGN